MATTFLILLKMYKVRRKKKKKTIIMRQYNIGNIAERGKRRKSFSNTSKLQATNINVNKI